MQITLGLFASLLLVTPGITLRCEVCSEIGTSCNGSLQTCADDQDTCVIVVTENSLVGYPLQTINKGCASSSVCNTTPNYMHFGLGKGLRSSTICCVGDACRAAKPQIPPDFVKPNGKWCQACYAVSPNSCNDTETVDCVGPEQSCLDMAVTITYGTNVFNSVQKGCASQSVCDDLKTGETVMGNVRTIIKKAKCVAPSTTTETSA